MRHLEIQSVLMVDDDETTIFLNKIFLDNLAPELEVNTAENGAEALDFLRAHLDDPMFGKCLVILDIEMPVMNGWDFLEVFEREFTATQKDKVFLTLLTIHSDDQVRQKASKFASVKEYLAKPLSDEQFEKLMNRHFPHTLLGVK
ncbi:MAG: response regulator [Bacteroidota bacterium]